MKTYDSLNFRKIIKKNRRECRCALFRPSCGSVSWSAPQTAYVIEMCTVEVLTSLELTLLSWPVVFVPLPPDVASSVSRWFPVSVISVRCSWRDISKRIHLVCERFILKINQNTANYSYTPFTLCDCWTDCLCNSCTDSCANCRT